MPLRHPQVLSRFGQRRYEFHKGIDLRGRKGGGDWVYASRDGRVILAKRGHGYGNEIILLHEDGYMTRYAHLWDVKVWKGNKVKAGHPIGIVGSSGHATTAHLHFEILTPSGRAIDPAPFIFHRGAS